MRDFDNHELHFNLFMQALLIWMDDQLIRLHRQISNVTIQVALFTAQSGF
jgi:hypothetical protein